MTEGSAGVLVHRQSKLWVRCVSPSSPFCALTGELGLGVSQEGFAVKAGIHRTYVSSIELGKVAVRIEIAPKLADTLEVPLSRLWKEIEKDT
jgi:DNA-binding XRE family transcriptional regulator